MSVRVRWLVGSLLVLVVLVLVGGTVAVKSLPRIVRTAAVWRLEALTNRPVSIDAVDVSLRTGRFSVRGLRVNDRDGGLLARFDSLEGRIHRRSLLELHLWIEDIVLTNGEVRIVRVGPDRFNISDILERPGPTASGFSITIDHFAIQGGSVTLEDRVLKPARTWRSDNIRLEARDLTTSARKGTAFGSTTVAGALVTVRVSDLQLFPIHMHADVNIRDLDLTLVDLYLPPDAPTAVEHGVAHAGVAIDVDAKDGVLLNAEGVVEQVATGRPDVAGDEITSPEIRFLVRELRQRPGSIALRYASLEGDVTVFDPTTSPPARLTLKAVTATASDLEQPMKGPAKIAIYGTLPGVGEVDISGTAGVAPRRADVRVRARALALPFISRHLPFEARVTGVGTVDVRVVATYEKTFGASVTGDVVLDNLTVGDGVQTPVTVKRVVAKGLAYTYPGSVRVADLTLTEPSTVVERNADGSLNLAALARRRPIEGATPPGGTPAASADAAPTVTVGLTRLAVVRGRARVADAITGGRLDVSGIDVSAEDVSWPSRGPARVRLSADMGGGRVDASGAVDLEPRRAELGITARKLDLTVLQSWLPIVGQVRGTGEADVKVAVALEPFSVALTGSLGVGDLAFSDGSKPLLTVKRVDATGLDVAYPTKVAIDRLRVNTPWAEVARNRQGELSLRAMFRRRPDAPRPAPPPPASAATTTPDAPPAAGPLPGMQLSVREAMFENGGARIIDDSVEPAARFDLAGSSLQLRNVSWPARGTAAAVRLNTPMPGGGTLRAHGTFSIEPITLALEAELDQVDLAPGRPYLPFDARVAGKLSGRAKITGSFGESISLVVDSNAGIGGLRLGDPDRWLVTADTVDLTGFRYSYPASVRIREVTLHKPWMLVERQSNGTLELVTLVTAKRRVPPAPGAPVSSPTAVTRAATPPPAERPKSTASVPVRVLINKLVAQEGFIRYVDRTTEPAYAEELWNIGLTGENLGTTPTRAGAPPRLGTVELRGQFASGTPLAVHAKVGSYPGPLFLDATVEVSDFPLPRLNPFLDRLSSYVAKQGTLTATLTYRVDGDELDAVNDVRIDGLELQASGHGGEFRRRTGLPLPTLVSLLKDRQGVINLNIPVRGRLSSPEFHYGDAVWAALRNLTIRLVALPFSLVGKMLFTEDSRIESLQIDPVTFKTAESVPDKDGGEQIARLVEFLKKAPDIRLHVRPVTTVADVTALRRQALDSRLAALGTDEAARRRAAIGLYTELFPRRDPPTSDEALYEELTRETPPPPRALRTLTDGRVAAVQDALVRAGIPAERVERQDSRTAVESEGTGRVEFEIRQAAGA